MQAGTAKLNDIFDNNKNIVKIPFFQRSYVWDEDYWKRFLSDMQNVSSIPKDYFMGSLILKSEKTAGMVIKKREGELIDGQQRLTTIFLFLRALQIIHDIKKPDLKFYHENGKIILQHNHNDKSVFEDIINGELDDDTRELKKDNKVLRCFDFFMADEQREVMKNIKSQNIIKRLLFISVDITESEDEQQIFDTMNSLGTPLKTSELLKNELFSKKDKEFYEKTWKKTFEEGKEKEYWDDNVTRVREEGGTHLDILLRTYLIIKDPEQFKKKKHGRMFNRYKEFVKTMKDEDKKAFIQELVEYANIYKKHIRPGDIDLDLKPELITQRLNLIIFTLDISTIIPYMLYVLKNVKNDDEKIKIFTFLESYVMRRFLSNYSSEGYNIVWADSIIEKRETYNELVKNFYNIADSDSRFQMPSENAVDTGFQERNFSSSNARLVLYFIEHHATAASSSTAIRPFSAYHIEHVMPKDWNKNWDIDDKSAEASDKRKQTIRRLGNLALIMQKLNSSLKNAGWIEKRDGKMIKQRGKEKKMEGLKECFGGLGTFNDYLKEDEWNEEVILKRDKELLEYAKELWKYKQD